MYRKVAVIAAVLGLAACATPNPLTPEYRESVYLKDAEVLWSVDDAKAVENNENYVEMREDIKQRLEAAVETVFLDSPSGTEPMIFKIDVKRFGASSAGGSVTADVTVIRESDGAEIGVYENVFGAQMAGGGLLGVAIQAAIIRPDVVGIMANNFATTLKQRFDAKQ